MRRRGSAGARARCTELDQPRLLLHLAASAASQALIPGASAAVRLLPEPSVCSGYSSHWGGANSSVRHASMHSGGASSSAVVVDSPRSGVSDGSASAARSTRRRATQPVRAGSSRRPTRWCSPGEGRRGRRRSMLRAPCRYPYGLCAPPRSQARMALRSLGSRCHFQVMRGSQAEGSGYLSRIASWYPGAGSWVI